MVEKLRKCLFFLVSVSMLMIMVYGIYTFNSMFIDHSDWDKSLHEIQSYPTSTHCPVPPEGFRTWKEEIVTKLNSQIKKNCSQLLRGGVNDTELRRIEEENRKWSMPSLLKLVTDTQSCAWVESEFMNNFYITSKEKNFPLAFTFVVHDSPHQVMRLLKVIYRPQNVYCIHVDVKADNYTRKVFEYISVCLRNVILPRKEFSVTWGWHTLMDAQMSCFSDLLQAHDVVPWKYVITLCGKEVPLKTNTEMISLLEPLNGTSAVELAGMESDDWKFVSKKKWIVDENSVKPFKGKRELGPIPHNLTLHKSMIYFALTPDFVEFILFNSTAIQLRKYLNDITIPEENFYATLFKLPGVPGGYRELYAHLIPRTANYIWLTGQAENDPWKHCNGKVVHKICIISAGDLHRLHYKPKYWGERGPLFHNKYFMEYDHTVMDCMEEEILHRNKEEYIRECATN